MELKSAIFDMDGVITNTAKIHFKAWKKIFDQYLHEAAEKNHSSFEPFTIDDYVQYVDGMSRTDGVIHFLQSRHLLPDTLTDEDLDLVNRIGDEKNDYFLQLIKKDGVDVFPSTIDLIKQLRANDIRTAAISSSKNAKDILQQANVLNLFDTIVDGKALVTCNLKGKPEPDIFLEAARRISSDPAETLVVEDALSGVIAGKKGQFGLVIGIDRRDKWGDEFKREGADIVVNDLSEVNLNEIRDELKKKPKNALEHFADIIQAFDGKHFLLFTDYDGTLTPIVKRPELARLSPEMKDLLYQLKQYCEITIISGRQLDDVEAIVALNGLYYAGNHGLEIIGPQHFATKFEKGLEFVDLMQRAYNELASKLAGIENCIIEHKKFSLSVHYRLVSPESIPTIEQIIDSLVDEHSGLSKRLGKMVFEIRPDVAWNKGTALNFLLQKLSNLSDDYVPIYLGDDLTDEDAFFEIRNNGIGILVSEEIRDSHASYYLNNPKEVYYFLKQLLLFAEHRKVEHLEKSWFVTYPDYEPEREKLREALCTLGNGYLATRGANEEATADDTHYPGTYFAGCYNRLTSKIEGQEVCNEDLVNMPNWLPISFRISGSHEWFSLKEVNILEYKQELNLRKGILQRHLRIKDREGRVTRLHYERFVSMANPHLAGQRFWLIPENWSGEVYIKSGIDGGVINSGVDRYKELNSKHLEILKIEDEGPELLCLLARTNQSHIEVAYTAFHELFKNNQPIELIGEVENNGKSVYSIFRCYVKEHENLCLEKRVTFVKNKDMAVIDCLLDSRNLMALHRVQKWSTLQEEHSHTWRNIWNKCEITIHSEGEDQRVLRLHTFHLLQTVSKNSLDLDIGVPARGLHGESYRGHIFWDELFILPFYIFYFPQMARSLLLYRYRRLNMARLTAKESGYQGAMYPWQSASNGEEVTQAIHLNPRCNEWMPDYSHYQRHVNGAIVYNIWQYYQATLDTSFLNEYGAEMMLEIARFWASISKLNPHSNRYEIHNVVGPDEYHEKYPHSEAPGVNNNAYTNVLAVWCLERALESLSLVSPERRRELLDQLQLSDDEITVWKDITSRMKVPFHDDMIISQFDGYEQLQELPWKHYIEKYGNIERLDRILKAENDTPDNYKVSKQADVLMLFYLFSLDDLHAIFDKLGYRFDNNVLIKNILYYLRRTSHGSTLSKVVLASLYEYLEPELALRYYQDVLDSDILDIQGGTTHEGIHLGAMASCIYITLMRFAGVKIKNDELVFEPKLPDRISNLQFNFCFHQNWLHLHITKDKLEVTLSEESQQAMPVKIRDRKFHLQPGVRVEVGFS